MLVRYTKGGGKNKFTITITDITVQDILFKSNVKIVFILLLLLFILVLVVCIRLDSKLSDNSGKREALKSKGGII